MVRQASRPEGSSPCWLQMSSTVRGGGAGADADELERAALLGRADPGDRHAVAAPVDGGEELLLLGLAGPAGAVRWSRIRCGAGWSRAACGGRRQQRRAAQRPCGEVERARCGASSAAASRDAGGPARGSAHAVEDGTARGDAAAAPAVARREGGAHRRRAGRWPRCGPGRGSGSGVVGRRVDEVLVGARDDQGEPVARRDDVVARVQVEGDRVRACRGSAGGPRRRRRSCRGRPSRG